MRDDVRRLEAAHLEAMAAAMGSNSSAKVKKAIAKIGAWVTEFDNPERRLRAARDELERDYREDVVQLALEVIDEGRRMVDDDEADRDTLLEFMEQSTDGCRRVIVTQQAREGLLSTSHRDVYQEEMGEAPRSVEAQMLMALRRDVIEEMAERGVDINDPWSGVLAPDEGEVDEEVEEDDGEELESRRDAAEASAGEVDGERAQDEADRS